MGSHMSSALLNSQEVRDEVVRLFDQKGLLEAVLYVRRVTNAGLGEAHAAVRQVLHEAGRLREANSGETSAELMAIGPFSQAVAAHLDYGPELYAGVPDGTKVVVHMFEVYKNDKAAQALAACLGADVWDFNTHALDPWRADLGALHLLSEEDDELIHQFTALRDAGFRFFYRVSSP